VPRKLHKSKEISRKRVLKKIEIIYLYQNIRKYKEPARNDILITENPCVGGSIPPLATNIQTPTTLVWFFFLCAPARPREHQRHAWQRG